MVEKNLKVQQKRGKGRPCAFDYVKTLTLKLPPEDIKRLKLAAVNQNLTVAQLIHNFIETGL